MKYSRINITAEGQTEMEFAQKTLNNYFVNKGILIDSRCVRTSKNKYREYRGGLLDYEKAKRDILDWIKEEQSDEPYFSTMFDLYALPPNFPKFEASLQIQDIYERIIFLENAFAEEINYHKFIPYIQLHEFEALLFANLDILILEYPDAKKEIKALKNILVEQYGGNPEKVNTGKETAPSKRIISQIPEYEGNKASVGATLAGLIGTEKLQQSCKHFADWIKKLEKIK